ncbi:MAG: carbohydrate-binding module family 20 domain-containing protein, partial [Chthoniobacterales bacterium]
MSRVRFEILPPVDRPEEPVSVCGNLRALGEWDAALALPLRWEGDRHVGVIEADTGAVIEYKILRGGSWECEAVDAWGSVPPNARHEVWLDATVHRTVADWKDRYEGRLTHDRIYSRTLAAWRELLVWLPPAYATEHERRFPVIYFNDGANVFD